MMIKIKSSSQQEFSPSKEKINCLLRLLDALGIVDALCLIYALDNEGFLYLNHGKTGHERLQSKSLKRNSFGPFFVSNVDVSLGYNIEKTFYEHSPRGVM